MSNFEKYQPSLDLFIDSKEDGQSILFFFVKMKEKNLLKDYTSYLLEKEMLSFALFYKICELYFRSKLPTDTFIPANPISHNQLDSYNLDIYQTDKLLNQQTSTNDDIMIDFFINFMSQTKERVEIKENFSAFMGQNLLSCIAYVNTEKVISFLIKEDLNFQNKPMFLSKILSYSFDNKDHKIINFAPSICVALKEKIKTMPLESIMNQVHINLLLGSNFANDFLEILLKRKEVDTFFSLVKEQKIDFRSMSNKTILFEKFNEAKNFSKEVKSMLLICGNKHIADSTFKACLDEICSSSKTQDYIKNLQKHNPYLSNCLVPSKLICLIEKLNLEMPKALVIEKGFIVYQNKDYLLSYKKILNYFNQQRMYGQSTILKAISMMDKNTQDYQNLLESDKLKALINIIRPKEMTHAINVDDATNLTVINELIETLKNYPIKNGEELIVNLEKLYLDINLNEKENKSSKKLKL
jgi:hypothetical protein